jgi:hypothetical protein
MTLRYAHLAPDQRRDAVAKLNERPISALTMRLLWGPEPTDESQPIDSIGGKGGTRTLGEASKINKLLIENGVESPSIPRRPRICR